MTSSIDSTFLFSGGRKITGSGSITSLSLAFISTPVGLNSWLLVLRADLLDIDVVLDLLHVWHSWFVLFVREEVVNLVIHYELDYN